jgi:cellulose synthase/poly-beta-1,6-N-acetylglucosamine synthase-like glycosyltransferase
MYLAEDRILCWELVSKRNSSWHLHYVKSAIGTTDVPDTIPDLVSQRRRWLNGSFFASVHATYHFYQMYRSRHSYTRKFFLHILIFYQLIQLIFSWFGIVSRRRSVLSPIVSPRRSFFDACEAQRASYRVLWSLGKLFYRLLRPYKVRQP